jgi:hypothetical protein
MQSEILLRRYQNDVSKTFFNILLSKRFSAFRPT